ncbi:putative disease resistance protein At1g50180 [Apium graveolens]|uniref:putative disease resistance protein At1g50180 n=1 Tax=Apium graveolens TaxID=4045 RepID=UPI003D79481D
MAEAIVSMVVGRLTDLLNEEAHLLQGVRAEIEQVVDKLKWMKTFLHGADSRIDEQRVRVLVAEVRDLVYDAENVVESFLLKASSTERHRTNGGLRNVVKRGVDAFDAYLYHHKFSREIKNLLAGMDNLLNCFRDYKILSTLEGQAASSSDTTPGKLKRFYSYAVVEPDFFVGFQKNLATLLPLLVDRGEDCYPVIFICGMGGLGKTTLANKMYNHSSIKSHFEAVAWVTISQKWQPRAVLQRILVSLVPEKKEETLQLEVDKLVENLLEIQQQKNCLIVLDDMWTNDAWDSIKAAFPTESSGSKLLLTSRNVDLAAHVNSKCFIHKPQLLDAEQSWELLRLKALPKADHLGSRDLKEMEKLGREMVNYCKGLPLAIVVLGGVLVTKPTFIEWEKVYYDSQSSLKRGKGLGEDYQREVMDILVWSYNVLPAQLKLCFLYLGKFREDEEIKAETLYQLWIAEGLVLSSDKSGEETMMEVAESYMGELVHKSMVQVKLENTPFSQRKFESCRLHDLMRDLSLYIAKREDYFEVINLQKLNDFHADPVVDLAYTRQVVIHSQVGEYESINDNPFHVSKANKRRLRSLLLFPCESTTRWSSWNYTETLRWNVAHFRFLRVFALEDVDIPITSVSSFLFRINPGIAVGSLVYLRYLSIKTSFLWFPSIQNLELLQTLKLEADSGAHELYFPPWMSTNILGKMGRLRHLYLPLELNGMKGKKLRFDALSKLETLEDFNTCWCEVKDLVKLTNLRKLTVHVYSYSALQVMMKYLQAISSSSASSSGSSTLSVPYVSLRVNIYNLCSRKGPDFLRKLLTSPSNLYDLRVEGYIPELLPLFEQKQQQQDIHNYIDALSSSCITTLTLSRSGLVDDPMPVLEKLPVLRTLELCVRSFSGKKMTCSATGFLQLTNLQLHQLVELREWRVEEGSMPNLSCLKISQVMKLEELPEGLKFLKNLQNVCLQDLSRDLCDKVRRANGEQGPDFYKVAHVASLDL